MFYNVWYHYSDMAVDIAESLIRETTILTKIETKTGLIITALTNMIQKEKIQQIKNHKGNINPDIDLDATR